MRTLHWVGVTALLAVIGCADGTGPSGSAPLRFISIATGGGRTCAVAVDSTAWCWGRNGDLGVASDLKPTPAFPGHRFVTFSIGRSIFDFPAACGFKPDGSSACSGRLDVDGDGTILLAAGAPLPGGILLAQGTIGRGQICGRTAASVGYCWGDFEGGVRGLGSVSFTTSVSTMVPNEVDGGHAWKQVVAGYWHTCGLDQGGTAWCWGVDDEGQLGQAADASDSTCGLAPSPCSTVPVEVDGGHVFVSLSAGGSHTCGVTSGGDIYCWGADDAGQIGIGGAADVCAGALHERCARTPVKVYTNSPVVFTQVSAGDAHTCGLSDSLQAYCWGDDSYGQLGIGGGRIATAWPVKTDVRFAALSAGRGNTCGVAVEGAAWCWGNNASGELGNGTTLDVNVPVPVSGP